MPTLRFRKLFAVLIVFSSIFMSAQAATYYWVGGESGIWNNAANWSTTEGGSGGTGTAYPGADDIVYIYGNVNVAINSAVSIGKLLIEASAANYLGTSFTTTLSGSGSLSVTDSGDAINITRCSSTDGVIGTLEIKIPVTCTDSIQTHSGTTLEINDELTTENLVHSAYGDTPKTLLKVNGTLTVNDTLNLNAMSGGATQLNVQSGKTVNAKKIIFGADDYNNTGVSSAIVNAGTIRVTEEFTIRNIDATPYTGSGKIQLDGNGAAFTNNYTGGTITITDLECLQSSVIAGSTNFTNITATGLGGNTLTINGSQTVTGDFDLSGSSTSSKLNIAGTGSLSLTNPLIADYLNFTGTGPTITSGTAYAGNSTGTPDDWVVVSANQHVWNGTNGSWGVAANWLPQTLPQATDDVIINSGSPVITSAVTIKSVTFEGTSGITVTDPGSLIITDATAFDTKITGSGKYIVDAGKTHTVSDTKALSVNIENKGTINITGASLTATSFSGNGTINLSNGTTTLKTTNASTTTNAVVLTDTDAIIQGNFEFASFTAYTNMGGKTITLNNASVKASSITLKGSGDSSLLSLVGSGSSYTFDTSSLDAQFLSIDSNIVLDHYTTEITDCVPTAGQTPQTKWLAVLHNGWNIKALSSFEYTWTGNTSNDWNTDSNWDTGYVPVTDCKIIISSGTPVVPGSGISDFAGGTLTIAAGASLQLGSKNLVLSGKDKDNPVTAVAAPLSNAGTIIYTGNGRITNSGTPINDTAHGTVEYASGGTAGIITDFIADTDTDDYCNLVISGTGWTLAGTLKMQTITIDSSATCTVNSATTLRAQTFNFNGDSTHKNINASANLTLLPYVATDNLTVPSGIDSKFTISSPAALHLGNASTNSIIFAGSDPFDFNYELNFLSPVTLNRNVTVEKTVTANAAISGSEELIFAGTDDIEFNAGTYTHSNITVDKDNDSGSLTINDNCLLPNLKILNGKTITFAGTPEITTYTDTAASGNLIFSSGATFTNAFKRNSGGTTQITGTISAASVTLKDTTISGTAGITTTGGSQTFNGTINGTTANTEELTLAATSVTFNDNVGATSLKKLTVNAPLTIGVTETSIAAGEIDFQGAISGDEKKLTVNTPIFKSTATTDNTITLSELTFAANSTSIDTSSKKLTFTVSAINGAEKTIALSSGSEAEFAAGITVLPAVTNSGTITCSRAVTFGGNINNTSGTLTCNNAATFKGTYSGTGATLTLSSGTTIFESNLDLSGTTFTHSSGTVQIGGSATDVVTVKGPAAPQAFYDFETSRSLIILGANSFHDFTTTNMGGKSISFEAEKTQTVNGTLSLSGVSGSLLTLKNEGTGVWTITCSNPTISYVDVINSTSTNSIFALNSNDSGNNTKWNFPGETYLWKGTASSDWDNAANWNPASVPGAGAVITINDISSEPGAVFPVLNVNPDITGSYNGNNYAGTITINTGATFDLADKTLTVGTITNKGTVRLKGIASQISGTVSNGDTDVVSTVEYYDTSSDLDSTTLAWGTSYKKLIINKPANLDSSEIFVSDTTTVTPGSGKNVSLNNPANSFGGVITLNAGEVTLNSSSDLTIAADALADSLSVTCADGKTININKITTSGAQTFDGVVTVASDTILTAGSSNLVYFKKTVTGNHSLSISTANSQFDGVVSNLTSLATAATASFNANITSVGSLSTNAANVNCESVSTTGVQTYTGAVTIQRDAVFTANAGQLIKFQNTLTGSGSPLPAVTIQTANSQFDGAISDLTSLTTAATASFNANITDVGSLTTTAANINCSSISTSGNQTYGEAVVLGTNPSLSSGGNILFDSTVNGAYTLTLNQASATIFNGIVQLTGFADSTSHTGSVTFKANTTISDAVNLNTPQTLTFGDADTDIFTFNSNLSHTAGNTSIRGSLSAANINLGTTSGTTTLIGTINGSQLSVGNLTAQGTIETSGSQIYNGTVALTDNLTLSSTAASAGGIAFASTIDGAHELNISTYTGTNGTTFNGTVGATNALTTLTVTGPAKFNCTSITSTGKQTYDGAVTVQSDTTLTANTDQLIYLKNTVTGSGSEDLIISTANSKFDGAISNLSSLTTAASTSFNANISSLGTLSTATANINCNSISTSGNQTYGGPAILGANLSLTSGANILFNSTLTGAYTLTLTQAASTTFNGTVQLTGFADAITHTGSVTFNAGGTISNATSFNTPQTVTFGNEASDTITFGSSPDYANLTHTSGATVINGRLIAADITLADTSGGPITITTPGLFLLTDGKSLSYTSSFTQNGNGNSVLRGNFGSAGGNGSATFAHSVQLSASGAASFGTTGDSISITDNLIITGPSAGLAINASTSVNENIVMYSGAVTLGANLSAQKDILILGTSYSETDTSTNITDEYAYTATRPAGWSTGNYNTTQLPDRTSLPATSTYSATLETQAGVTVTAGKNFYANHTELKASSSGQWILKLPDLTNPANGFAEAYFTKITDCKVICNDNSDDGSKAKLISLEDTDSDTEKSTCTNVDFDDFKITSAYTVRDNVICVVFNRPVRYHSTIINSLKFSNSSASPECSFTGLYSDPDCQNELNYDTQMSYFYIKAAPQNSASTGAWNTDATGKYSGNPKSSDRFGFHHDTFPCLDFPRSLPSTASAPTISFLITDRWGKRLNNYSRRVPKAAAAEAAYGSADSTHVVEDKTGPVLWTVRTGQELHTAYDSATGEASQHSYDSHNFLEFRYSEPVDVGSITAYNPPADPAKNPNIIENIQVTDSLGAISENITYASNSLTFAGLARITGSSLRLYTGSNGAANKYVNALYRTDEYSVRLSVVGWTDGTVTDYSGNSYKKWPGYIEAASQFTGARAHTVAATNNLVKDQAGNYQIEYAANKAEPLIISNASDENSSALLPVSPDLYSSWDISSPVFAPLRFSKETEWGNQDMAEAIGNTNGSGSTLDRIDFHFFDNTPSFTNSDEAEWYTEIGWCSPGSEASKDNLKDSSYTYCADIVGGARQFDSNSTRRTTGGIRFSTKAEITPAFRYSTSPANMSPDTEFQDGINNVFTTIVSQLFTGSSSPMRPANDPDGLYLGLGLSDTNLSVETTFSFSYNESLGYLTDLAGNRLRSKVLKTIDRTPPSFDIILSPVDNNEVFIIFVKKLVTDIGKLKGKIKKNDGTGYIKDSENDYKNLLPRCFRLISIDENGNAVACENNQIDTSIPAQLIEKFSSDSFTCFKLTLKNNITIDDVKNHYLQLIIPEGYTEDTMDPLTNNTNSKVTFIMDEIGNYMSVYHTHALSDFAINYVNPLYAYSSDMLDNGESVMKGLYEEGSWAVHDWNADQKNYGTLPANHPISIVADTKGNEKIRIYLTPAPDEESVSTQFNSDFETKLRVWLPDLTDGIFRALSAANNTNYAHFDGSLLDKNSGNSIFNIDEKTVSSWASGNQISFMFGLMEDEENPVRIYNNPYYDIETGKFNFALSTSVPLFSLRMTDKSNIESLDLWSFKLKGITTQRGGVTILNNVINASKGENTVVMVELPEDGRLNVCIMTLDGNIITYLNRGKTTAGEHYFTWNGKNRNGAPVARGIYFVRVTGAGIDETRKVMVVKD